MLFNLFKSSDTKDPFDDIKVGLRKDSGAVKRKTAPPKRKKVSSKPKATTKQLKVKFSGWIDSQVYEGVVVHTKELTKRKPSTVYIVSVIRVDGRKVTPYLKWINEEYCKEIRCMNLGGWP